MIKPLMYDCFKLDLRIIMIGFREHVTQNVSDLTDVLEAVAGYLFLFLFFLQHTSLHTTTWKAASFYSLHQTLTP